MQLCNDKSITGMDDFVRVSDSREKLQELIDVVHNRWRIEANVSRSAAMVFARRRGEDVGRLPRVCSYGYLHVHVGIDFACNGVWDVHVIKK